jgi:putative flippase GtrA
MPERQDQWAAWPWRQLASRLGGRSARQVFVFLLVGVSNTILTYLVYLVLLQVVHYGWAFTGAFAVGLIYTGLLNFRLTFGHHPTVAGLLVFSAYYGLYYVFSLLLLRLLVDVIGISEYFAPLLMLPIVVPVNFVMTKLIVHRFGRARD